jgi:hypothetical protein
MRAAAVVEGQIPANPGPGLRDAGVSPQIDLLVFDGPPQTLDKDVSRQAPLPSMLILISRAASTVMKSIDVN